MTWRIVPVAFLLAVGGAALTTKQLSAQTCDPCEDEENLHSFSGSGTECWIGGGGPFCEDGWFDCGEECHTSLRTGTCDLNHDECFFEQDDAEALEAAISNEQARALAPLLAPLGREGRLTYVVDRQLLLVRGCNGAYVAGFPVGTGSIEQTVLDLVLAYAVDR